jgi:hypothetical protein|tara:strand:- start:318 stop:689 length:372 start_codon:yes stop_codon:yes gene_type:complete
VNSNLETKIEYIINKYKPKQHRDLNLFNRDKTIKSIMKLEAELFMPKHVPKGTEEDPDNPDYREFSQEEKDNCHCMNCERPFEWWQRTEKMDVKGKEEDVYLESDLRLRKYLQELEDLKVHPV